METETETITSRYVSACPLPIVYPTGLTSAGMVAGIWRQLDATATRSYNNPGLGEYIDTTGQWILYRRHTLP